ncbi:hypothetical protein NQ318_005468 [Aromia moschata]|uniref:Mos1 transposase HTH domain-containing protein n=1 Tax=Aromia moschata TaxID=1265417 RepID=A0AAV8YYR3_9CUCU|nr:hypothetical protein NQ318_005468 [Aromia moschata]
MLKVFRWINGLISSLLLNWGKLLKKLNYAMLKEVYGNECLSRTQVFEWSKGFKEGRETTEDDPRPRRPSTSKTDKKIGKLIREDRCLILHESFNMRKVSAKMVPKLLTPRAKGIKNEHLRWHFYNIDTDPGLLDTVTLKGTRFESVEAVKAIATERRF